MEAKTRYHSSRGIFSSCKEAFEFEVIDIL